MPKENKIKQNKEDLKDKDDYGYEEIKIKEGESSLTEFIKKPIPTDKEIEEFEEYIEEEAKEEEIEDSLNEIYHDDKGKAVDVKKLDIKKRRGFLFWFSFI